MKPRKVLVVDHSQMMHKMYEVMMRQYPLAYARDGREAPERLRQHPDIDLVLLDLSPVYSSPLEFLTEIGTHPEWQRLAVILVGTTGQDADIARGLELGARAAILKPFQAEELLDKIDKLD